MSKFIQRIINSMAEEKRYCKYTRLPAQKVSRKLHVLLHIS